MAGFRGRTGTRFVDQDQWEWCDEERNPLFDPSLVADWLKLHGTFDDRHWRHLVSGVGHVLRLDRIEVRLVPMNSLAAGAVTSGDNALGIGFHGDIHLFEGEFIGPQMDGMDWRIVINERFDPAQRFVTLVHELAHIYCGHLGRWRTRDWPDRSALRPSLRENEAELVAMQVATAIGLRPVDRNHLIGLLKRMIADPSSGGDLNIIRSASERIAREAGIVAPQWTLFRQ